MRPALRTLVLSGFAILFPIAGCGSTGDSGDAPPDAASTGRVDVAGVTATVPAGIGKSPLCRTILDLGGGRSAETAIETAITERRPAAIRQLRELAARLRGVDDPRISAETTAAAAALDRFADEPTDAANLEALADRLTQLARKVDALC